MSLGKLALGITLGISVFAAAAAAQPSLFLVGDSITKTGTGDGSTGPWGMGYEIIPLFDAAKIHAYNEGLGGRSSRGYIEEGAWAKVLARIQPGDYVLVMFGHNDAANSANYPDRITLPGNGDDARQNIHSYGWYLRQYAADVKSKRATIIICSPVPRNQWIEGKIKRGFDGYADWAKQAAAQSEAIFIDLNTLVADRMDAIGQDAARKLYNDTQHTTKAGARINAESVIAGLRAAGMKELAADLAVSDASRQ